MTPETTALLHELRNPHNDFPSYLTDLCARAAAEIDRFTVASLGENPTLQCVVSILSEAEQIRYVELVVGPKNNWANMDPAKGFTQLHQDALTSVLSSRRP